MTKETHSSGGYLLTALTFSSFASLYSIVGKAKRSREKNLKSFAIEFDIQITPCKILSKRYNKV